MGPRSGCILGRCDGLPSDASRIFKRPSGGEVGSRHSETVVTGNCELIHSDCQRAFTRFFLCQPVVGFHMDEMAIDRDRCIESGLLRSSRIHAPDCLLPGVTTRKRITLIAYIAAHGSLS
jgi:hypothetical protein